MDRSGTSQVPPPPPPRPAPPPVSPTGRPGEPQRPPTSRGPSALESAIPGVTESRSPERAQVSRTERPQSGHGGEGSDKNPIESTEGHSATAQANPFDTSGDSSTPLAHRAPRSREGLARVSRKGTTMSLHPGANTSEIDWIVPVNEKPNRKSCSERLAPTMEAAKREKDKYQRSAAIMGYSVNIAIGLQVLLGALTTGIAAAAQSGRQAQVSTSILGGMSTLVASYLARTRGTGEPELSIKRASDLDQFLRECSAFDMDRGHEYNTKDLDQQIDGFRRRFEELIGNTNAEKRGSPA